MSRPKKDSLFWLSFGPPIHDGHPAICIDYIIAYFLWYNQASEASLHLSRPGHSSFPWSGLDFYVIMRMERLPTCSPGTHNTAAVVFS